MAMLTLNGLVQNVYTQAATTDRETGEVRPASLRAQILCENTMESGEKKLEMVTLKVHTEAFKKLVGQKVRIPVGAFVAKGRYHVFTRSKMKRNPSRLLEKEKPRERLDPFRARPVSYVLMNNTTDMQSVSRTRHKSAQISAISQNATGQCAQAAAGAPPRGSVAPGWKQAPLVLMRNYEPLSKIPWRDGWNASRSVSCPRHPPRFQNCKMPAYSRPRQGRAGVEVQEPQDSKLRRVADLRERLDVSCLWG